MKRHVSRIVGPAIAVTALMLLISPHLKSETSDSRNATLEGKLDAHETERELEWFEKDPNAFMLRGLVNERSASSKGLIDEKVLKARNAEREIIMRAAKGRPREGRKESLDYLIDTRDLVSTGGRILTNLTEIETLGLNSVKLANDVWSGPGWSMYKGSTAQRYALEEARTADDWSSAWEFVSRDGNSFYEVATGQSDYGVDSLSPAEKYDLLIGTPRSLREGAFSKFEWDQGRQQMREEGEVAKWHGYCHGWAPASTMLPRPLRYVEVPSADGSRTLRFYPSDMKALATALWANALPAVKLIGTRCEEAKPKVDNHGRVQGDACFSVNPSTIHLALVNQLGVARRNLLIDSTYSVQVWNKPVVGYAYHYFNPITKKAGGSLAESRVAIADFKKDRFKKYRSPEARYIVGVKLQMSFKHGNNPSHSTTDSDANDVKKTVAYLYDLELNERSEAIGGEWYQVEHPDFIWVVAKDTRALSDMESSIAGNWSGREPVPYSWRDPAVQAASRGQPLAAIVERLLQLSRR